MKKIFNKNKEYLIAPLITCLLVLFVYLLKGIYPFGKMTIANGDMGQAYMTFYYYFYDFCHGAKSIFYDYTLGLGSNTYGGFIVDGLLNPTAYVVLLNSRDNIPYMFSFVLLLKFMFVALTSYILFKKINKKYPFYNYLFSVLYALSAYSLMYNTNFMWLDVVGLFPLFVLATKYMFDKNNIIYFGIVLALILMFNYNLAYMVLMFIIFIIPIYIHYGLEKEKRKKAVFNLIFGVLLSIGLSAFAFIPSFLQVLGSYRFSGSVVSSIKNTNFFYKTATFIFYALPIYFYFRALRENKKKDVNIKMINISLILSAVIPIIFERVNLWWHSGSYQGFPFRYGFIPLLILYMGALYYINNYKDENKTKMSLIQIVFFSLNFVAIGILLGSTAFYINTHNPALNYDWIAFSFSFVIFIITFILYHVLFKYNKKCVYIMFSILTGILIIGYTFAFVGVDPKYRVANEWSDDGVFYANDLYGVVDEDLYRLKDLSLQQYENSPMVSDIPSMSTFLHIISEEQVLNAQQLAYSSKITKLNDFGGTLFTDALYGMKYVISTTKMDEELYTFKTMVNDNYLYEYKYVLPYGILYDKAVNDIPKDYRGFSANNYLYKELFNKKDDLIDIDKKTVSKDSKELTYEIIVDGKKELYLYIDDSYTMKYININGVDKVIPVENNINNKEYPTSYDNGIIDLGLFENETVKISMSLSEKQEKDFSIEFGLMDIEKYKQLFSYNHDIKVSIDKNKINIEGNVDKDTNIFLPITYDEGFTSNVEINRVYNTFIGVPLKKGDNSITLTFKPKLFTECLYVTIVTIILMIIGHFVSKKFDIRKIKFITFIFWLLGVLVWLFMIYKFYIVSIFQTILDLF